jgi:hypothetical protein
MINLETVPETEASLTLMAVGGGLPLCGHACVAFPFVLSTKWSLPTWLLAEHFCDCSLNYLPTLATSPSATFSMEFLCTLLQVQNVSIHKCKIKEMEKHFLHPFH